MTGEKREAGIRLDPLAECELLMEVVMVFFWKEKDRSQEST